MIWLFLLLCLLDYLNIGRLAADTVAAMGIILVIWYGLPLWEHKQ